jgi:hypothetical protein
MPATQIERKPILFGGSASTTLGSGVNATLIIPRQARRLNVIDVQVNVTIAGPTGTASRNAIENLFPNMKVIVSDKAGSNRTARSFSSACCASTINRRMFGKMDRYNQQAYGKKAAATYNLRFSIPFADPLAPATVKPKTSLPLWQTDANGDGVGDDVRLELTTGAIADVGLSAGTVTINSVWANLEYNTLAGIAYYPTEIITNPVTWPAGGGEQSYSFPEKGYLATMLVENYTSATVRADIGGTGNKWQFITGRTTLREFDSIYAQMKDGEFQQDYPQGEATFATNDAGVFGVDFWHNDGSNSSLAPDGLPNLYLAESGDRAYWKGTNLAASATSDITLYKILATDLSNLVGV